MNDFKGAFLSEVMGLLKSLEPHDWARMPFDDLYRIAVVDGDVEFASLAFDAESGEWIASEVDSTSFPLHSEVMASLEERNYVSHALSYHDIFLMRNLNSDALLDYASKGFHVRSETWLSNHKEQPFSVVCYDAESKLYSVNANRSSFASF